MPSVMEVWQTLSLGSPVTYLSGRSLCEFPNVHLTSAEGTTYSLNRAVLAAASHLSVSRGSAFSPLADQPTLQPGHTTETGN